MRNLLTALLFIVSVHTSSLAETLTVATFNAEFLYKSKVHVKYGLKFTMGDNTAAEQAEWAAPGFRDTKFAEAVEKVADVVATIQTDVLALSEVGKLPEVNALVAALVTRSVNYPRYRGIIIACETDEAAHTVVLRNIRIFNNLVYGNYLNTVNSGGAGGVAVQVGPMGSAGLQNNIAKEIYIFNNTLLSDAHSLRLQRIYPIETDDFVIKNNVFDVHDGSSSKEFIRIQNGVNGSWTSSEVSTYLTIETNFFEIPVAGVTYFHGTVANRIFDNTPGDDNFVDKWNNDYTIKVTHPGRDKGTFVTGDPAYPGSGIFNNYISAGLVGRGTTFDIGAFEYDD